MSNRREIAGILAEHGLRITQQNGLTDDLIPPIIAAQAVSYPFSEGRIAASIDIDDPDVCEKANADWYRLSVEGGLFKDADRRFLLALHSEADDLFGWVHAELTSRWDIMGGAAASGLLGNRYCRPEFVMLSRDGRVICRGTTWQYAIGTILVKDPRTQFLQKVARGYLDSNSAHSGDLEAIRRWLNHRQGH